MALGVEGSSGREPHTSSDPCSGRISRSVAGSPGGAGRIHVLFLIDELCRKGGAESALLNTVRWLPPDRFRCSVITFRVNPALSLLAEFPEPVQVLPLRRTYDWQALRMGLRLAGFIRREKVDIVHTYFATADLWGGAIARLCRRPAIISSRRDMGFLQTGKHRLAYRLLRGMYDRVITVSEQVRAATIEQDKLDPGKVITIYNAVEVKRMQRTISCREVRERLGLGGASHVIVAVGNFRRIKGFEVFIRAAARVCREFPAAVFVIAGGADASEPDCLADLQRLCADLGLAGNLKFLGPLEDVIPLLKASDVFCLLSHSEGFSNALLEAMACGLPCIATRVGGNGEALDNGRDGFLVEDGDSDAAADLITGLLRNSAWARQVGAQAQDAITRRFVPEAVMPQLMQVYDALSQERRKRGREAR